MDVIHRIGIHATDADVVELRRLGIEVAAGLLVFEVAETHAQWPEVRVWIGQRQPSDVVYTTFTDTELDGAHWLAMRSTGPSGYPEPNPDDFGYRAATYDLSNFCEVCGIGLRQKEAFRFKKDPGLRRTSIRQLNWVFDEFFVHPELWEAAFRPNGVPMRSVVDTKGTELASVVQLDIRDTVPIETLGLPSERCPRCDRVKYLPLTNGPIPSLLAVPSSAIVKTEEWFGSGGSAYREVLISQDLRRGLRAERARGVSFIPVTTNS